MRVMRAMIRLIFALALPLSVPAITQAAGPSPTQAVLRLCFEDSPLPPWRSRNRVGLYFDVLRDMAHSVGMRVEFSPQPWPYCQNEVFEGRMDGAFAVAYGLERVGKFAYPPNAPNVVEDRMRTDPIVIVRRRGTAARLDGGTVVGLQKPIGVQAGYAVGEELKRLGLPVEATARDHIELLQQVVDGQLDAAALGSAKMSQLTAAGGQGLSKVEVLPQPLFTKHYFLVFSNAFVERDPALAQRLWAALRKERMRPAYLVRERAALEAPAPSATRP